MGLGVVGQAAVEDAGEVVAEGTRVDRVGEALVAGQDDPAGARCPSDG
jgi:hypothetical protein